MPLMPERIESVGLSHYSYLLADDGEAIVIDPRRDIEAYVDLALGHGLRIAHVLETHRHEDFVLGSVELAARTGAHIWHADAQEQYAYGEPADPGRTWHVGGRTIEAIATPGHTAGHVAYLLREPDGTPYVLFSGDLLMAGEMGRTDLAGKEYAEEASALLYDSLQRIRDLPDGVLLCPAHGGGSACGAAITDREWTTLGLERRLNRKLSLGRDEFVRTHAEESRRLPVPPYFARMREVNLDPPRLGRLLEPEPLTPSEFAARMGTAQVLDVRGMGAFSAGHVPGSLSIPLEEIGTFGGWFLGYDRPILLVTGSADATPATTQLVRIGFDEYAGTLAGGDVLGWLMDGQPGSEFGTPDAREVFYWLSGSAEDAEAALATTGGCGGGGCGCGHGGTHSADEMQVLDVSTPSGVESRGLIGNAVHIPLRELPARTSELASGRPTTIVCPNGVCAAIAASLLEQEGFCDLDVMYGGMNAWTALGLPTSKSRERETAGAGARG